MSSVIPLDSPKLREDEHRLQSPITKCDPSTFENYLEDASNFKGSADALFIPFSEKQISDFLKECSSHRTPVTVEGAHTGLAGGGVPEGGIALSLEKLAAISEIKNDSVCVEAGVPLRDVQDLVESKDFLYPPDPTEQSAFIGGTVATNASGPRTFKYGATRPHVKRIRVLLSTGDVLDLERGKYLLGNDRKVILESKDGRKISFQVPLYAMPKIKNVAGYFVEPRMDFIDLFIGSEGTLGVITELELGLVRRPDNFFALVTFFKTEDSAVCFVIEARKKRGPGIEARALEYFDSCSLGMLEPKFPQIPKEAHAAVFLEQEVDTRNEDEILDRWLRLIMQFDGLANRSWVGLDHKAQEKFLDFRHELPVMINESMARRGFRKVGTDMAVPDEHLAAMMKYYKETIQASGLDSATFGHIGNNHLHVNLLPKSKEEFDRAWALYHDWIRKVIGLGGTVSAEHGIGKIKVPFLEMMYGPKVIREMAALKKALDPASILGRGNVFRQELL